MKIGKLALEFVKSFVLKDIKKRRKSYPPRNEFKNYLDIKYLNDDNKHHTYDIYLADESNSKDCLFIDIHGGAYIFEEHYDNYPYAYMLLKAGFDVALIDYTPNNGKRSFVDQFDEVVLNIKHLFEHLDEYDLSKDKIVITGDSAGGHFALLLSEILQSQEVRDALNIDLPLVDVVATVIACPVYDFAHIGQSMKDSGTKRMLGPQYKNEELLNRYSPRTYINQLKSPLFLSTCTNDFIRPQSILLNEDMKDKKGYQFIDINSDDKNVDHVHNITKITLKESIEVNDKIVEFVDNLL